MSRRAVSPVVGVVLLLAITVALGVTAAVGATSLANPEPEPPQASIQFELDPAAGLVISHESGDAIDGDRLAVRGTDPDGSVAFGAWPGPAELAAGDAATLPNADGDEVVTVVWSNGDRSFVLAEWDGAAVASTGGGGGGGSTFTLASPEDPGHAYVDRNRDYQYDSGTDDKVPNSDLEDDFSTGDLLIVPDSVGTLSATDGTTIEAEGIYVGGDLDVSNSGALNGATLDAGGYPLVLDGASVDVRRDQATTRLTGDSVEASNADVVGNGEVVVRGTTDVTLSSSTVESTKDGAAVTVRSNNGGVDLGGSTVAGDGQITVLGQDDVSLGGGSVGSSKNDAAVRVESTNGGVSLGGGSVTGDGAIDVRAQADVSLGGGTVETTNTKLVTVESTNGGVDADTATVRSSGSIDVIGAGTVDLSDATVATDKRGSIVVQIRSTGGDADVSGASLTSGGSNPGPNNQVRVDVAGSLDTTGVTVVDDDGTLTIN